MNNLKSLIRSCDDKPMQIITDFIVKPASMKVVDVVEFKAIAQGVL